MTIMRRKEHKTITTITLAVYFLVGLLAFFHTDADAQKRGRKQSVANLISQALQFGGVEGAEAKFAEANSTMRSFYYFDETEFEKVQGELNLAGRCEFALAFAAMTTRAFTDSPAAWEQLADRQILAGDRDGAIASLRKTLELTPDNEHIQRRLAQIDIAITDAISETDIEFGFLPGAPCGYFGDYLGEEPPGITPAVFAPGLISTHCCCEYSLSFSPDGDHLLFSRDNMIYRMTRTDDGWTAPLATPFQGFEPAISPDGASLFIGQGPEIMQLERTPAGWRAPTKVADGMDAMADAQGNLYLTTLNRDNSEIAVRPFENGAYGDVTPLPATVNSPQGDAHPCIAPDGSFLIFDSCRPGALGGEYDLDFYICFRTQDGGWSPPRHLGDVLNTPGQNIRASLSPDGMYLFYTAYNDIYWVSTEILDPFRD